MTLGVDGRRFCLLGKDADGGSHRLGRRWLPEIDRGRAADRDRVGPDLASRETVISWTGRSTPGADYQEAFTHFNRKARPGSLLKPCEMDLATAARDAADIRSQGEAGDVPPSSSIGR